MAERIFVRSDVLTLDVAHSSHSYNGANDVQVCTRYMEMLANSAMRSRFFFILRVCVCVLPSIDDHFYKISKLDNWISASFSLCVSVRSFVHPIQCVRSRSLFIGNMHIQHIRYFRCPVQLIFFFFSPMECIFSATLRLRSAYISQMIRVHNECVIRPVRSTSTNFRCCRYWLQAWPHFVRILCARTFFPWTVDPMHTQTRV